MQRLITLSDGAVLCGLSATLRYFKGDVGVKAWAEMRWTNSP